MPRGQSGNSFQRGKSLRDLGRSGGTKKSRSNLLIVVEGETEENYFCALKRELRLTTIEIKIVPVSGGDPMTVVKEAHKLCNKNKGIFDDVFCVFDHDNKPVKYNEALNKAKEYKFIAITSIPCFEFWYLLHYCFTTSPFANPKELCAKLEAELRKAVVLKIGESYNKSDIKLYEKLKPKREDAFIRAIRLAKKHPNLDSCTNPSTKVHCLVKKLLRQKNFE